MKFRKEKKNFPKKPKKLLLTSDGRQSNVVCLLRRALKADVPVEKKMLVKLK